MKLQKFKLLSAIYQREEDFSADLANDLSVLDVGSFTEAETESKVGTREADVVAKGDDGILVVENQFGKADWDHWGRLEAYARLKHASVAVLIAESFEELMIVTCNLRNEDSEISWFLIEAQVNTHDELSFHQVVRPAIDIQVERSEGAEMSEFWEPVRKSGLFAGKPVLVRDEGWIAKSVNGVSVQLQIRNDYCTVRLSFSNDDRIERRNQVLTLFPASEYKYELQDSPKFANIDFPVLDKGKKNRDDWPEIREKLVALGTDLYNKVRDSGL